MPWEQLKGILDQSREDAKEAEDPPVACPKCGAVLQIREGVRNCPTGDYRWP